MKQLARIAMFAGSATTVFGLSHFHGAFVANPSYVFVDTFRLWWAIVYVALLAMFAYGFGLPDLTPSKRSIFRAATSATFAAAASISFAQLALGTGVLPRYVTFGTLLLLIPWFALCAHISGKVRSLEEDRDRVVLVGSWADATDLTDELKRGAEQPALIVASLDPMDLQARGTGEHTLSAVVADEQASVVVLDREAQTDPRVVAQVSELHERGVRVRTLSLFYEQWLGKLPVAELERVSLLFDIGEVHRRRYARQRRVLDVAVGLVAAVPLALVVPFVFIGNLLGNRGSLFFMQQRIGHNGQKFEILKFRTMTGSDTSSWTTQNDPRITPFGHFLRSSHIDELPQVINILRGDLALVGPRPEQAPYVDELREKLPFYDLRHLVKPGLTGWAQVKFGYAANDGDALEKLQYEFYYLRHQGLALDLRIVVRTLRNVLRHQGR